MEIFTTTIDSPIGPLCAGARDDGICLLEFTAPERLDPQLDALRRTLGGTLRDGDHVHLRQLRDELAGYFAGRLRDFTVPLVAPGTPFQERVWSELRRIPYGQTRSYEDLARSVSGVTAHRAVGRANGANRIAIVIPCHRVVNKNGGLGGYGGGLWRKELLLRLEGAGPAQLTLPGAERANRAHG
jgi:AraC family transcriptional regulator, regulatory protein of adaptative response / methylated-DNA-[protein]-cysteine methyltransferase